jgi:putative two-component system response regulator
VERKEEIIDRLSTAVSFKDAETGLRTKRVGEYANSLARAIGMSAQECSDICLAAPMHDIGKIGIRMPFWEGGQVDRTGVRSHAEAHTARLQYPTRIQIEPSPSRRNNR